MREEVNVTIREAIPEDAQELLAVTKIIGAETDFLVMDEEGMALEAYELAFQLDRLYESPNNVLFVAFVDEKMVGVASIRAESKFRMAHIGEVGLSILQEYWGIGLGSLLMDELILWSEESQIIRRLELTVQQRNQRAVHLYEKFGFQTEGILQRGARLDDGQFLDVQLMSLMID
ncbi:GNAT family acetyltransferase [Enterococcus sp. JM4C]|uniref:GNAT family N-acetyltransferase n=1 Tax=Candidatus Enterococcus huntleyi TaxID=1857217 RepID=UPI00137B5047|nr:GNAT family N-acetyltransferase [Enterococcus sp. JM4C]KAF1295663.1 GNAT family acetyltransferase [Enterococcus sp. JM4C]